MPFSHGNVHSDTAKEEQIIRVFFAVSLDTILKSSTHYVSSHNYNGEEVLSSPSSSSSSSSSHRPRDKRFNLALRECPAALETIDFWRHSNLDPMFIDVVLVQQQTVRNQALKERDPNYMNSEKEDSRSETKTEKVIERWVVQYEIRKASESGTASKRSGGNLHTLYKKSTLLLRSLYATVRLLPAYKLFRELISSGQIQTYALTHHVNSFVEPFTRKEEADMDKFSFTPVDTSSGRLCISVSYHTSVSDINTEPSTPISPQFIPDYVGSPLVDPFKRFPSLKVSKTGMKIQKSSGAGVSISRSSNRLSIQDNFDDSEFACHFVADDDDMMDLGSSTFGRSGKSENAAVGALVLMLKKAQALHLDRTNSSKTTADAFAELRSYGDT